MKIISPIDFQKLAEIGLHYPQQDSPKHTATQRQLGDFIFVHCWRWWRGQFSIDSAISVVRKSKKSFLDFHPAFREMTKNGYALYIVAFVVYTLGDLMSF